MQDSPDDIATKHSVKRLSALNDHEGHFLRRRLNTYKKIHEKELNDVVNHLEEIRETMKSLSVDPTYGTHTLQSSSGGLPRNSRKAPAKSKLRRTQSFPEVKLVDEIHSSFPLISGRDSKQVVRQSSNAATSPREVGKYAWLVHEPYRKTAGKRPSSGTLATAESSKQQLHRKVERSKTAPINMLQPLLKTTPEMMKKKIHLSSSSPRQQIRQRPPQSSPRGAAESASFDFSLVECRPMESRSVENRSLASARRRPTPSLALQLNPTSQAELPDHNKKGRLTNSSVEELFSEDRNTTKDTKISAHTARDAGGTASGTRQNHHNAWIIEKPPQLPHSTREMPRNNAARGIDDHESSRSITKDLKQCRYLQFVKDRPGNNFI